MHWAPRTTCWCFFWYLLCLAHVFIFRKHQEIGIPFVGLPGPARKPNTTSRPVRHVDRFSFTPSIRQSLDTRPARSQVGSKRKGSSVARACCSTWWSQNGSRLDRSFALDLWLGGSVAMLMDAQSACVLPSSSGLAPTRAHTRATRNVDGWPDPLQGG